MVFDEAVDNKSRPMTLPFTGEDTLIIDIISGNQNILRIFSGYAVTGIQITNSGSGYTSVPTVVFGGGEIAAATAFTSSSGCTVKTIRVDLPWEDRFVELQR